MRVKDEIHGLICHIKVISSKILASTFKNYFRLSVPYDILQVNGITQFFGLSLDLFLNLDDSRVMIEYLAQ